MMNRSVKESLSTSRNGSLPHLRRGALTPTTASKDTAADDNSMDLFSRNRPSLSLTSSDESSDYLSAKLARLSVGAPKQRNGLDDLIASNQGGKHDYDWLLTPPGTPIFSSSDGKESQTMAAAPRSSSLARSVSTTKTSRLSVSQSESNHSSRPARSSSVTRSSISTTQYTSYSNKTNILNTSSASVSSYIRPSTPTNRSSSTSRPSTPSTRPSISRSSTPSRTRPSPTTSNALEKPRLTQTSRPSTPSSRAQIPANLSTPPVRSISRPSTPTRRNSAPSLTPSTVSSASIARTSSNGRNAAPSLSRPSSPGPRVRPPPQPIVLPDFPHDTPPNLRTTMPDRPVSAGRSRPGAAITVKGNVESTSPATLTRRQSSPIVNRGRLVEPPGRGRPLSNGHVVDTLETRKTSHASELSLRKAGRPVTPDNNGAGFGRSISKNSLNMAIKHMDIRNGNNRPLTGSTLFPQSIRAANSKSHPSSRASSVDGSYSVSSNNNRMVVPEYGNHIVNGSPKNGAIEDKYLTSSKLTDVDIYESSRYDAILLKEDLKNTSWLHSVDDNSDQLSLFDNGFESLPEPFGPL